MVVLAAGLLALVTLFVGGISGVIITDTAAAETKTTVSTTDATISEPVPNQNYGSGSTLYVDGDNGSGKDYGALIKWDLSGISPGTKVSSASITLTVTDSSSQTYEAYMLKRAWVEWTATWNNYDSGKPWEVAGAKGSLDRDAAVAGTITPLAKGKRTFTLNPAVVQSWVDNPASNHGIIIADTANTDGFDFYSREAAPDATQQPQLTINLGT